MALRRLMSGLWRRPASEPVSLAPPRDGDVPVAVVIPLYNHARFIDAALRSVLAQTAPPSEIVVIDDGSRDGGFAIAEQLLDGVDGCQVLRQDNAGAHATINRAVELCRASHIAVLNSDDLFLPDKLEFCQQILADDPAADLIAGRVALMDANGAKLARGPAADWLLRAKEFAASAGSDRLALLNENDIATTSNIVFSRRLWERVGGFAPLRYCHDLDFLMQAFDCGRVVMDREREHVMYRVHDGNTIGEDIHDIRVEIAAVIAATLRDSGSRVLPDERDGFESFAAFLRNKNLSDLLVYLIALRDRFDSRAAFYQHATSNPLREQLAQHLRARAK